MPIMSILFFAVVATLFSGSVTVEGTCPDDNSPIFYQTADVNIAATG